MHLASQGVIVTRDVKDADLLVQIIDLMIVGLLGGRVAEALVLDDISTGASNDLERATELARDMITRYGMSEALGPINFGSTSNEVFIGRGRIDRSFPNTLNLWCVADNIRKGAATNAVQIAQKYIELTNK